jgi:inner membrane protein
MDNLTHSVVGLGLGALIDRSLPPEADASAHRVRQRMLLTIGCLASNFPDLDLVLTTLLAPPLGYLLHHRGHTHTLLAALGESLLLLALVRLLWPGARRLLAASGAARLGAVLAAGTGLLAHLGMDALNVYGVHPFWPFDGRWVYGDLVFIVEPVFWIAFGVPLAMLAPRAHWRRSLLALLVLAQVGFTLAGFLHPASLALLLVLAGVLGVLARRLPEPEHRGRTALAAGLAVSLAFVGIQALALQAAHGVLEADLARRDAGERMLDMALSAYPANPLCWNVVTVAVDGAGRAYHLRSGLLSIAPAVLPAPSCPAPLAGGAHADAPQLAWAGDARIALADPRAGVAHDCHLRAWMRFARMPLLDAGSATDLRWGPRNFSTIDLAAQADTPCPLPVPGWGMPRADLLQGR